VVIADDRGAITLVNEQTEHLFGYAREDLVGRPVETLLPGRVRDRHVAHRADYVAHPGTRPMGVGLDLADRRKDGSEFSVDISLSAVETDSGSLVTAFVRDITQRKRTEDELAVVHEKALEASRLKSEFVANMSHEIRTPLNGVIGMSSLLLDTELNPEQREYAEAVSASGDALMSVISDILDFSKIEAGKLELDRHAFELREVVDSVSSMLATAAHERQLELMAWVDADVPDAVYGA
jgi:PAS domain S-box-containing protein